MTISKVRKVGNYIKNTMDGAPTFTMSLGNHKLSHDILIWNLPAITTCPNTATCRETCYARKAEKLYPSVLPCRTRNHRASERGDFVPRMIKTILHCVEKYGVKAVRVHESGDFYGRRYANDWKTIALAVKHTCPDVVFFAYTKSNHRPAKGFNIVESILPDGSKNYGPKEWVYKTAKRYHARICPYGLSRRPLTCGVECTACQTQSRVLFVEH